MAELNGNKAAGSAGIVIEMLSALDDFGIDKITHQILKSKTVPID